MYTRNTKRTNNRGLTDGSDGQTDLEPVQNLNFQIYWEGRLCKRTGDRGWVRLNPRVWRGQTPKSWMGTVTLTENTRKVVLWRSKDLRSRKRQNEKRHGSHGPSSTSCVYTPYLWRYSVFGGRGTRTSTCRCQSHNRRLTEEWTGGSPGEWERISTYSSKIPFQWNDFHQPTET